MDQVGYPGVTATTFIDAMNGKSPPAPEGEETPGITTDSLEGSSTAGFGKTQKEGLASSPRDAKK